MGGQTLQKQTGYESTEMAEITVSLRNTQLVSGSNYIIFTENFRFCNCNIERPGKIS